MTLELDRSTWKRVRFGDVVRNVNVAIRDLESEGVDRVVAMEHMNPGELALQRWGSSEDGTTFTRRVRPGQTLFGKRRAYQRKVAYATFDAVCSGDILTFEAEPSQMLPEFLPFVVQSDGFFEHALGTSAGSLSPRTNWRDLSDYEFALPPTDEQQRLADLLWRVEAHRQALLTARMRLAAVEEAWLDESYLNPARSHVSLATLIADGTIQLLTGPFGSTLSAAEYTSDGVPVIHPSFIVDGRLTVDHKSFVSQETADRLRRWQVQEGDLIFMRKRDVARSAIVRADEAGWVLGSDCISVRMNQDRLDPEFVRAMLRSPSARAELIRRAPGTAMPGINERSLSGLEIPSVDRHQQRETAVEWRRLQVAADKVSAEVASLAQCKSAVLDAVFGDDE